MVIREKGSVFCIDGKEFKIGGGVFANDESEYMGLYGTVTEIRTDEDRETENDTPGYLLRVYVVGFGCHGR